MRFDITAIPSCPYPPEETHILVVMGGLSDEREVSLKSGKAVCLALKEAGFQVSQHDLGDIHAFIACLSDSHIDCVFNALHGGDGEDGHIPALLDLLGIPYTHSGVAASAVAMDKIMTRKLASRVGCNVAAADIVDWHRLQTRGVEGLSVAPPCVIKPANAGSTVGCVYVPEGLSTEEIVQRLPQDKLGQQGEPPRSEPVLVESYIPGRELTVSVLAEQALACTEIAFEGHIFDYDAKYISGSEQILPARLPDIVTEAALSQSERVHDELGCLGLTRSDFRWSPEEAGSDGLVFIELNSHPGLTSMSLSPRQAAHVGLSFPDFCTALISHALRDSLHVQERRCR